MPANLVAELVCNRSGESAVDVDGVRYMVQASILHMILYLIPID